MSAAGGAGATAGPRGSSTVPWYRDGRLRFGLGIENTFVPQERPGERALDEYELTEHYGRWHTDLGLAAEVGADFMRWGIPWHRVNPQPGVWEWGWTDRVMDRFGELGLRPIVDLVHYGTPLWLDEQFLHPDYPQHVAEYAVRAAERYASVATDWTPVNEPMIHALFSGEYGYWPPYRTGAAGLVEVVVALSRGFVNTQRGIAEVQPTATFVHVDASLRYAGDVDEPEHRATAARYREQATLVEDLVTGRVDDDHALVHLLRQHGVDDIALDWFNHHAVQPDVMGVNYYPRHSTELFERGVRHAGGFADPRPTRDDGVAGLVEVLRLYADRYAAPVMLAETCVTDDHATRVRWMGESVAAVEQLRKGDLGPADAATGASGAAAVDVVGYTWWPLFDMVEWTYRHSSVPAMRHRLPMGLFDLVETSSGLERRRTSVAEAFASHARLHQRLDPAPRTRPQETPRTAPGSVDA